MSLELLHFSLFVEVRKLIEGLVSLLESIIVSVVLESLSSDSSGELNVLLLDGDTVSMDAAQDSVLKETDDVGLSGFLASNEGIRVESQVRVVAVCDITDNSLEGKSGQNKFDTSLIFLDFSDGNSSRLELHFSLFFFTILSHLHVLREVTFLVRLLVLLSESLLVRSLLLSSGFADATLLGSTRLLGVFLHHFLRLRGLVVSNSSFGHF